MATQYATRTISAGFIREDTQRRTITPYLQEATDLSEKLKGVLRALNTIVRCIGAPRKYYRLKDIPSTYNQDSLITLHMNTEPMLVQRFQKAWAIGGELFPNKAKPMWRTYTCCWAAEQALHVEGDFVECGVNLGGLSRTITEYVDFNNVDKDFYLFDTYRGLDPSQSIKGEEALLAHHNSVYYDCYEEAKTNFKDFPRCRLVRGTVPGSLTQVDIAKVAYLSIDMNCTVPEVEALRHFWPKLSPGAIVVLDDYGWVAHHLQKKGIDEFMKTTGVGVLTLPTGQGLIVKPSK